MDEIYDEVTVRDLLKYSPAYFGKEVFGYRFGKMHNKILDHIIDPRRSLTLVSRGHGKSLMVSVYIAWLIVNNPNVRVLLVSKTDGKAQMFVSKIKAIIEGSPLIEKYYGNLEGKKWTDHAITLSTRTKVFAEPTLMAIGANSSTAVGMHCDVIILDDIVDFDSARSSTQRERMADWYRTVLLPTLVANGRIAAVGTRYAAFDLYNDFEKMGYDIMVLPAIGKDGKALCEWIRPLNDTVGENGEVLVEGLSTIKRNLGSVIFALQYQNDAELLKQGTIVKYEDIQFYTRPVRENGVISVISEGKKTKIERVVIGVDPAISQKEMADYTGMIVTGRDKDKNIYILEIVNKHLTFSQQIKEVVRLNEKWGPHETIVEKVGYQEALIQELQKTGGLKIRPITPVRDKVARLMGVAGLFEAHSVFVQNTAKNDKFVEQLVMFPDGAHDDMVDALVYSLMGQKRTTGGVIKFDF